MASPQELPLYQQQASTARLSSPCNVSTNLLHPTVQLPLPRYVEKANCSVHVDDKSATSTVDYDKDNSILMVNVKPCGARSNRSEAAIRAGGSIQCGSPLCLALLSRKLRFCLPCVSWPRAAWLM